MRTSAVYAWARQVGFWPWSHGQGLEGFNRGQPGDRADLCRRNDRRKACWARCAFVMYCGRNLNVSRPKPIGFCGQGPVRPEEIHRRCFVPRRNGDLPSWADSDAQAAGLGGASWSRFKNKRRIFKTRMPKAAAAQRGVDCRVYARLPQWIRRKPDRLRSEARWAELERQLAGGSWRTSR